MSAFSSFFPNMDSLSDVLPQKASKYLANLFTFQDTGRAPTFPKQKLTEVFAETDIPQVWISNLITLLRRDHYYSSIPSPPISLGAHDLICEDLCSDKLF